MDVLDDPKWRDAVILVSGNEQRIQINLARAVAFATTTNQPVIAWRLPLKISSTKQLSPIADYKSVSLNQLLEDEAELMFYFVKGAPIVITENICVAHRIANGTRGIMHSLTLSPSISDSEWNKIMLCKPGEIHWLPLDERPITVNVEIQRVNAEAWNREWTLKEGCIVIPIPLCPDSGAKLAKTGNLKNSLCLLRSYYMDLAFAVTFHKVQGRTEDKVILDFNPVGNRQRVLDLATFYVAVSRVRNSRNIRVLPIKPETKRKLEGLKFGQHLISWYLGTDSNNKST
jgi:hypothetical protein